jgi:hypothetical protein
MTRISPNVSYALKSNSIAATAFIAPVRERCSR